MEPNKEEDKMEMISKRTTKAMDTIKDAFIARPIPLSKSLIFGMNLSKRNDLNTRKALKDNNMLVVIPVPIKMLQRDGTAINVIKSNLFQLSCQ